MCTHGCRNRRCQRRPGDNQHGGGQKRQPGAVAAEYKPTQESPQRRTFHHIHGRGDVDARLNLEAGLLELAYDLAARIDARAGPTIVQCLGEPAEKGHAVPRQQRECGTVCFEHPPFVGHGNGEYAVAFEHAVNSRKRADLVVDVLQHFERDHEVDALAGNGKGGAVVRHAMNAIAEAGVGGAARAHGQILFVDVDGDGAVEVGSKQESLGAAAAPEVQQHTSPRARQRVYNPMASRNDEVCGLGRLASGKVGGGLPHTHKCMPYRGRDVTKNTGVW